MILFVCARGAAVGVEFVSLWLIRPMCHLGPSPSSSSVVVAGATRAEPTSHDEAWRVRRRTHRHWNMSMVYDHASRDSTPGAPRARSALTTTTTHAHDATRIAREASTRDDADETRRRRRANGAS